MSTTGYLFNLQTQHFLIPNEIHRDGNKKKLTAGGKRETMHESLRGKTRA